MFKNVKDVYIFYCGYILLADIIKLDKNAKLIDTCQIHLHVNINLIFKIYFF